MLSMQKIDPHTWCFLSGRICALENNLLRKDFFEHLLPLERPKELLACLKESPLREDFLVPEDVLDFEEVLQRRFFRLHYEVKELSPTLEVWELLQTRYDLMNLKNYLKEKLTGLRRPKPFPSPYVDETWEALWGGLEATPLGQSAPFFEAEHFISSEDTPLLSGRTGVFQVAIKDLRARMEEISKNPGILDLILDAYYLYYAPQLAERTASSFIVDYYLEYQKLLGILFLWRAEMKDLQGYIPRPWFTAEKDKDWEHTLKEALPERIVRVIHEPRTNMVRGELPLLRYERAVQDTLMERLEAARFFVFGPERVFGYLRGLETETLNLRLAIGGRLQGLPPEYIIGRLRKGYV